MNDVKQARRAERLDKVLAQAGVGSRKEVRQCIRAGRVTVAGAIITDPAHGVNAEGEELAVDGLPIRGGSVTVLLNKPSGVVTATRDPKQRTVLDLFPPALARRLFPAGRLDKDTEGLLILTDNGELCHRLISPNHAVEKEYSVTVDGSLSGEIQERFAGGIVLADGYATRPARLEIAQVGPPGVAKVTLTEGKYHQIKRMFAACGLHVTALKRIRIGALHLPEELPPGGYDRLIQDDIDLLFAQDYESPSCNS